MASATTARSKRTCTLPDKIKRPTLRAVHVIGSLAATHGGPSYSVPRLCAALSGSVETTLMSVAEHARPPTDTHTDGYRDMRFALDFARTPVLRHLRQSHTLSAAAGRVAKQADVIHSHGLWLAPNIASSWIAARTGRPHVITPRGMLSPIALSYSKYKKRAFWALFQGPAVRNAACLHATSEAEYDEFRAIGLTNPVAIIPNGIDLPDLRQLSRANNPRDRVILSLGRIHPKKGLDRLIRAWAKLEPNAPTWRLRIAGPAEDGHDIELRNLAVDLGLTRLSIEGPLYEQQKWLAYRQASVFVLPTLNENFGLTVAEALAAETPVISTVGAPWSGLETAGCGWWIPHGIESMAAALATAMTTAPQVLNAMGLRGRRWVDSEYSWTGISDDMYSLYNWILCDQDIPAFVRTN